MFEFNESMIFCCDDDCVGMLAITLSIFKTEEFVIMQEDTPSEAVHVIVMLLIVQVPPDMLTHVEPQETKF